MCAWRSSARPGFGVASPALSQLRKRTISRGSGTASVMLWRNTLPSIWRQVFRVMLEGLHMLNMPQAENLEYSSKGPSDFFRTPLIEGREQFKMFLVVLLEVVRVLGKVIYTFDRGKLNDIKRK